MMGPQTTGGVRAVLFDFDFTLGDSSRAIVECVNYGLGAIGRPPAGEEAIRRRIGLTLPEVLVCLGGSCSDDEQACFVRAFHRRADEVMEAATEVYADGIALVRRLRAAEVRTGIVSTKVRYRIESILERRGLAELFDVVVGIEDVREHKPSPEGLLLALERLGVAPVDGLYVGDHEVDVEAAKRAGVRFVGVLTGMTKAERFNQLGMPYVCDLSGVEAWLVDGTWTVAGAADET